MTTTLLIGTRKSGFIASSDPSRRNWTLKGPYLKECEVNYIVIPEESDQARMSPDGKFRIFRSRNRGASWEPLTQGLPQANAHVNVMRLAMVADSGDPAGVYVGTQGGQVLASRDAGDTWDVIFNWLPPVYSSEAAAI